LDEEHKTCLYTGNRGTGSHSKDMTIHSSAQSRSHPDKMLRETFRQLHRARYVSSSFTSIFIMLEHWCGGLAVATWQCQKRAKRLCNDRLKLGWISTFGTCEPHLGNLCSGHIKPTSLCSATLQNITDRKITGPSGHQSPECSSIRWGLPVKLALFCTKQILSPKGLRQT
jgi:hypothetical protein